MVFGFILIYAEGCDREQPNDICSCFCGRDVVENIVSGTIQSIIFFCYEDLRNFFCFRIKMKKS